MNVGRYLRGEDRHVGTTRITKPKDLKMNDRIKELAEQAGFVEGRFSESGDNCELKIKKLIELTVLECSAVGFNIFDMEIDAPASDLQYYVRDGIIKHFGVDE